MKSTLFNYGAKLFFALMLISGSVNAQSWQWLTSAGSASGGEIGRAACTDAAGNAYFCGNYAGAGVTIGGFPLAGGGSNDVFVCKFNAAGTCLWAVKAGGTVSDIANGICTDGVSVYITGTFAPPSATFGPFTINTTGAASDGFIAKLDCATGNYLWAVNFSNSPSGGDVGHAMCIDGSGNPYLCGNFSGTVNFGSASYVASGPTDFFVARVNPSNGALVWGAVGGGTGGDNGIGSSICYVPGLNEIVAGSSFSTNSTYYTTTPASGPFNFTNGGGNDIVLLELNAANGAILSALQHAGGVNEDMLGMCYDPSTTNVMMTGYFASPTITFGSTTLTNAGGEDIFIASYNPSTNTFPWAQNAGGTLNERGWGISSAGNGVISVTGQFRSSPTVFGSTSLNAAGFADVFVTALVPGTGAYVWAIAASSPDPGLDDVGRAVAYTTNGSGNVYVCGQFASTLTAGAFTTTSNGSVDIFFAKLLAPPPLTATQSQVNLTCNGVCTGSGTVVASGGVAPYTYSWAPSGGTGATASSLCAAIYTCTITDNVGTQITKTFTITQPPAIVITPISQTNVSCNGGANGAASVSASGGTGTLTYNWTPGNPTGDGTGSVTGLTAQVYTVTVTDANSCVATRTFNITQPPVLLVNPLSQTNVACFGGATGAASVSVSGGTPAYSYNWTPGNPTGDGTASVTGLTAGTWTCTVTDANSCVATRTFNITSPTAISVTAASQTNISCNGGSNGAASINTATGGAGGYTYNWTPGNPTGDGTISVTGLTAGTWTCTVTDANACNVTVTFNVTQPSAISTSPLSQTNISCNGGANGAASINTPTGGAGGYTYNWTPGNPTGDGTTSVSGLTAGTWTCTITDANSCVATVTFNITQPTPLVVTPLSQTNVSIFGGNDGAASINTPTGGAGGYTYNWTPGNPTGDGTTSVTGLTAGTWTCTVTDANGCTATQTFNITQPAGPGAALNLDGTNDLVTVPNSASLNISSAITLESWVYATKNTGVQNVMCKSNCTTSNTGYIFPRTDDGWVNCVVYMHIGGAWRTLSAPYPGLNQWVHVAATYDGSNMRLYINGVLAATSPVFAGGIFVNTNPLTIGAQPGCATENFGGSLDECRIWNRALCQSEIQNNMSCEIPTNSTGLVANYHFNQGSAAANNAAVTTLNDASSSANNGTLSGFTLNGTTSNWIAPGGVVTGTSCGAFVPPTVTVSSSSQTNVSCFGGTNGAASVTASGGSGLTYNWTPGNPTGDGTASVTGLTAGTWTCTVTNNCGGSGSFVFTITQPTALVATAASQTNVSCNGGSNGAAAINTPTGGAGGYTYNWTPGNPTGDGTTAVTGLTAGTWTCTVTDANSCVTTVTFNITAPTALVVNASSQTNVSCNGGSNGAASVTVSGGTAAYSYNWTPGNPTGDGTANVTGLTAGTWTCTVTDANSCVATRTFSITAPTALSATSTQTNVTCAGGANGAATVSPTGGTPSYTYSWAPSGGNSATATGLIAGCYTCTITDANGCTATASVCITQPIALSLTSSVTNVSCNAGSNGSATVSVMGGTIPYSYSWAPSGGTSATASGLAQGTYTCTVTDANGCTLTESLVITEPSAIVSADTSTDITCFGSNNGSASVNMSGGTGPYSYMWSPSGGTGASATGLGPAMYTCTVTDANGCIYTSTFLINEPSAISANQTQNNISCAGGGNGQMMVSPSGGTGAYTYAWAPITNTTNVLNGSPAGFYTCTITDVNGCTATATFNLTEPPTLTVNGMQTNVSCNGGTNGDAMVMVNGGVPGYTYSWSPSGGTGSTATGLAASAYTCTITDANGCTVMQAFIITEPVALSATTTQNDVSCPGGTDGDATVTVSGGIGAYTYSWSSGGTAATESNLSVGSYTCTTTDANGCTLTTTFSITEPPAFSTTATTTNVTCNGGSDGAIDLVPAGGTAPYTFSWNSGAYTTEDLTGIPAGSYSGVLTDANGCIDSGTVVINEPIAITTNEIVTGASSCTSNDGSIDLSTSGGINPYTFAWSNSATTEDISGLDGGVYSVVITDVNGCTHSATFTITEPGAPTVMYSEPMDTACQNPPMTFTLSGEFPAGGTWTGPGVSGNVFDPNMAGVGYNTIVYSYTDSIGCSGSAVDSIWVDVCMDVATNTIRNFDVYPNPSSGIFTVNSDANAIITVYDAIGNAVMRVRSSNEKTEINLSEFASGVYMISVQSENVNSTQRIILDK